MTFEQYLQEHTFEIRDRAGELALIHPNYFDALWEVVRSEGKHFRPNLLLSVIRAYKPSLLDASSDFLESTSCAVFRIALALEVMHTYSLIHDDLPAMDDATLRRGISTLHVKYDETMAILVGDALNTYAFDLISTATLPSFIIVDLVRILSWATGPFGMVAGQAIDCHMKNIRLDLDQLKMMHTNKTAKLIAASLEMGGVIAGLDSKKLSQLHDFGLTLGLFFQIRDDLIDVQKSSLESLKSSNKDADKNSYVTLLGVERTREELANLQECILKCIDSFALHVQEEFKFLRDFLEERL